MRSPIITSVGLLAFVLSASFSMGQADLTPRTSLAKETLGPVPDGPHRLIVKFRDALRARAHDGAVSIRHGEERLPLNEVLQDPHATRFEPLIALPEATIQQLESRAMIRSGVTQPDLAGMFTVSCAECDEANLARRLHASDLTEFVYFQHLMTPPPCDDIAPQTPLYFPALQSYHSATTGVAMENAWRLGSARGEGITVADCEYGVVTDHEDLCRIISEPGQTVDPAVVILTWDEHGTAVMGEIMSIDNQYGCTGLAPDSDGMFFPEWTVEEGFRRATAIANAIASVNAGDIVLLEMQTSGPTGGLGPAELDPAVWTIVRNGSDAGVIIVGAAGNGNEDLDSPPYAEYRDRGDSGAIIVGAGTADASHDRLSFSTYGSRVNLQGWGESVFSLGYGDFAQHGGDKNQRYTSFFSGTSSASPFVAASCAAVQSLTEQHQRRRLSPLEMRDLLVTTGTPQGTGGNIGPIPHVARAADIVIRTGGSIDLTVGPVSRNAWVGFSIRGGVPGQAHYIAASSSGIGTTEVAPLGVALGITQPRLVVETTTDGSGDADAIARARGVRTGQTIWFQACTNSETSGVVERRVQ